MPATPSRPALMTNDQTANCRYVPIQVVDDWSCSNLDRTDPALLLLPNPSLFASIFCRSSQAPEGLLVLPDCVGSIVGYMVWMSNTIWLLSTAYGRSVGATEIGRAHV